MKIVLRNRVVATAVLAMIGTASGFAQEQADSLKQISLDEVTVAARQNPIKVEGSLTTVKVAGTPYASIGTLADMLSHLPGLVERGNGIEVVGSGKPLFVIDGREIQNEAELSTIMADNIKDVAIETNPGVQYGTDVAAVVNITTKKSLNDYLFLQVSNSLTVRRKISDFPRANLRAKFGKFTTTLSYGYGYNNFLNKETYFRTITYPDSTFSLTQPRRYDYSSNTHSLNWMGEYQFNEHHRLGVYFFGQYTSPYINESGSTVAQYGNTIISDIPFEEITDSKSDLNSISAMYNYKKGNATLQITQDVAFRNSTDSLTTGENTNYVASRNKSSYDVYTTTVRYFNSLPWKINLSTGAIFNYVNSSTKIHSAGTTTYTIPALNTITVEEYTPQAYLALVRSFGNVQIVPAVRYEYTKRVVTNTATGADPVENVQTYSNFYPSLSVNYQNSKGLNLYASYSEYMMHPNFSNLNSGLVYHDSYSYNAGNPELESSLTETVRFGGSFKGLNVGVHYKHTKNAIEGVESVVDGVLGVVRQYSINIPNYEEWETSIGYSWSGGNWDLYANVQMTAPYAKVPINGKDVVRNQISFGGQVGVTYSPFDWLSFYTDFDQQGHRQVITLTQKSAQNWNFGVNAKFLKDRLTVNLEVTDILNRAHYNNVRFYYENVCNGTYGTTDSRGVSLRLTYTIFNKPIQGYTRRSNESIIYRTQF